MVSGRRLAALVVAAGLAVALGCTQTVYVRTDVKADRVVVDGEDLGPLSPSGEAEVDISLGVFPVPYELTVDGKTYSGTIEREEPSALIIAGATLAAVSCVPCCTAAGCCAANPQLLATPVLGLICSVGGPPAAFNLTYSCCASLFLRPGWLTAPLTCAGCAAGSTPLLGFGVKGAPELVLLGPGGAVADVDIEVRRRERAPALARGPQAF